jgi:HEAT repeat protein
LATAPTAEVARRAGWAFLGLKVSDKARYVAALRHPHPKVRSNAAYVLQCLGAEATNAEALVQLLADPDEDVRQRAVWALEAIGPDVIPLRRVRRSRAGGRR